MAEQPTLYTERLALRPFAPSDAARVQELAGCREVAAMMLNIPHPYPDGAAEEWIGWHVGHWTKGTAAFFAITLRSDGQLVGSIALGVHRAHGRADLFYWIGQPYWGQGYATEAARAVVGFGFEVLALRRIVANVMAENAASRHVLEKLGMVHEGHLRQHVEVLGVVHDLDSFGLLAR